MTIWDQADTPDRFFEPMEQTPLSFGERFSSAMEAEQIRMNSWSLRQRRQNELLEEMQEHLGPNEELDAMRPRVRQRKELQSILDQSRRAFESVPENLVSLPRNREEFDAEVNRRLQAEYEEATDVSGGTPAGSWGAELLGGLAAGAVDHSTVLTLPIGGVGGSVGRVVALEALAGTAGEALSLPDQFDMAQRLDIEDPDALTQLATAGAISGGLGGVIAGGQRLLQYRQTRGDQDPAQIPDDTGPIAQEQAIMAAEDALLNDRPVPAPNVRQATRPVDEPYAVRIDFEMGPNRPEPPNQPILDVIGQSVEEVLGPDARIVVTSGQEGPDRPQFGSNRHRTGNAADVRIYRADGTQLLAEDPEMKSIARAAAANGARGIGFGPRYMHGNHIHIDMVEPGPGQAHTWGDTGKAMRGELTDIMASAPSRANAEPPSINDYDFSRRGNASPVRNRIGYVHGRLLALGHDPIVVHGLVGNLMQESGVRLNAGAVGDNGNAFGIAQWNGPRMRAYKSFANARGKPHDDLDTQIAFLDQELRNSERRAYDQIREAPDAATAARLASELFWRPGIPHVERRMAFARELARQYQGGRVPRWDGQNLAPSNDVPRYYGQSTRGYTRDGEVTAGDGTRLSVKYEVVDASLLQRASGDLQPRDRSRGTSDEQIAQIASSLDPARLMQSPEADRGAPIVGPDNVIESGNGRVAAIARAAEHNPDRFARYRSEIAARGFDIPAGIETPVLIARRETPLDDNQRRQFVRDANTSSVARMSATERAAADAAGMSENTVRLFDPSARLNAPENRAFTRAALAEMPQAERNGLVDASGALNKDGVMRLRAAMFARAFDAPDLVARFAETDAGELKSLLTALEDAAPGFAALRADIAAGLVRPEMDISGHVMQAVRIIADARAVAAREGSASAKLIEEALNDVDLFNGRVAPLTAALVRKFTSGGRTQPAASISAFLSRYASEARKSGSTEADLFDDVPGPIRVLQAIDEKTFGDLDEVGATRAAPKTDINGADPATRVAGDAFADGATSPTAIAANDQAAANLRADIEAEQAAAKAKSEEFRELFGDIEIEGLDGTDQSVSRILDDLDLDDDLMAAIDACPVGRVA